MRCNVDLLKIIQVGLTLADEDGNYPQDVSTWQFNFRFSIKCVLLLSACSYLGSIRVVHANVSEDMYAPESIELLRKSGIDLDRHTDMGIEPNDFAELMITSGLVLAPETKWISFHRSVLPFIRPVVRSLSYVQ